MNQRLSPSLSLQSYVNCALGIQKIGTVLICFGSVNAISAVCIGHVVKHVKRYPTMLSAAFFNTGLFMVLLWWRPCRQDVAMFYVIAACLGLCDAIWQTQTNSRFIFSPFRLYTCVPTGIMTCQCFLSSGIAVVIWFLAISSCLRSRYLSFGLPRFRFSSSAICNVVIDWSVQTRQLRPS